MYALVITLITSNCSKHFYLNVRQHIKFSMDKTKLILPLTQMHFLLSPFSVPGAPVHPDGNLPQVIFLSHSNPNWPQNPADFTTYNRSQNHPVFVLYQNHCLGSDIGHFHSDTATLPPSPQATFSPGPSPHSSQNHL